MNKNIVPGSFVAISDFHAIDWPLDKITNYYLNEYDTIYILGDATDRGKDEKGTGGIDLLRKIKKLTEKYPGRVIYVPGNHDEFLYDYAKNNNSVSKRGIEINHGSQTIIDIDTLKNTNPQEYCELIEWLGKLPIQYTHIFNNKKYVLAHALFNQRLYDENPFLSLEDLYKVAPNNFYNVSKKSADIRKILWFRKDSDIVDEFDLPSGNSIMVIGHTPPSIRAKNLDLTNARGENIKVYCVDGGVAFNGVLHKYDGGSDVQQTVMFTHIDTSPKNEYMKKMHSDSLEDTDWTADEENFEIFKELIIELVKIMPSIEEARTLIYNFYQTGDYKILNGLISPNLQKKLKFSYNPQDMEFWLNYYNLERGGKRYLQEKSIEETINELINETSFEYIYKCLLARFGKPESAKANIIKYFSEQDLTYITNSEGRARDVAKKIGITNLKKVILNRHCTSVSDYLGRNKELKKYM